jgi:hypothetical protein
LFLDEPAADRWSPVLCGRGLTLSAAPLKLCRAHLSHQR